MVASYAVRTDGLTPDTRADRLAPAHPALYVPCPDCGTMAGVFCPGGVIHQSRERQAFGQGYL